MTPKTNRLAGEKSPYLLQHAHNPVDWYPWGEEAFAKAREEDMPVFLSIGYSTCHWCHVMERESFEDEVVARALNDNFISIKVDREERPDIDQVYMDVCQLLTGSGGWPLTIVMTPDKKPFFAATYLPKESIPGRVGMVDLAKQVGKLWRESPADALEAAENIAGQIANEEAPESTTPPPAGAPEAAATQLAAFFDAQRGGFGSAPKFPTPQNVIFLLRHHERTGNRQALEMAVQTLTAMRLGGIWDHLGKGFHRYSTDKNWLLPHFEKMLYDQGLLAMAYAEAYRLTGDPLMADTAAGICEYVMRDLSAPEGGFYSAEDADSEGVEGKFYVWGEGEIDQLLGEEADLFKRAYNIRAEGNFQDEATGVKSGANVLHLPMALPMLAQALKMDEADLAERLARSREKLVKARAARVRPRLDDKILTDWNGLMIAGLASTARHLDRPELAERAALAADFLLSTLVDEEVRLLHRYREGEAAVPGMLADYASLCLGLIELSQVTPRRKYIEAAARLADAMLAHFSDESGGALFQTADDAEELIVRRKDLFDGAIPSGNSVAHQVLTRLAAMLDNEEYAAKAEAIAASAAPSMERSPAGFTGLMLGLEVKLYDIRVAIAGDRDAPGHCSLRKIALSRLSPSGVIRYCLGGEDSPGCAGRGSVNGRAAAWVCRDFACKPPITDPEALEKELEGKP